MTRHRLDPLTLARLKRVARCPDCDSRVTIDESGDPPRVGVAHDDGCPALAALRRQGRASSVALVRRGDESAATFAAGVAEVACAYTAAAGPLVVRLSPYADLHTGHRDGEATS